MARFPKPPEGSWTQHYPELGTQPVSYEDSISPQIYELERAAIFKRAMHSSSAVFSFGHSFTTANRPMRPGGKIKSLEMLSFMPIHFQCKTNARAVASPEGVRNVSFISGGKYGARQTTLTG